MALTEATLKSYLYRYRKQHADRAARSKLADPGAPVTARSESLARPADAELAVARAPVSPQTLERVMKPDPAQQADEMAYYERLAKHNRRSRKP